MTTAGFQRMNPPKFATRCLIIFFKWDAIWGGLPEILPAKHRQDFILTPICVEEYHEANPCLLSGPVSAVPERLRLNRFQQLTQCDYCYRAGSSPG